MNDNGGDLIRQVEKFIYAEADLLDGWRLNEWEALLDDEAEYLVPPIGVPEAEHLSPGETMFIVAESRQMLAARVERMMGKAGFAELPRSNVRHLIGNVQVLADEGASVKVSYNLCVYRIRRAVITTYIGRCLLTLTRRDGGFRIREKRVMLDIDVLKGQGGLSIIL